MSDKVNLIMCLYTGGGSYTSASAWGSQEEENELLLRKCGLCREGGKGECLFSRRYVPDNAVGEGLYVN